MAMLRVRVLGDGFIGGPAFMTFYFTSSVGVPSGSDASDVAARVRAAFNTASLLWSNQQHFYVSSDVDLVDEEDGQMIGTFTVAAQTMVSGSQAIAPGPNSTGGLLQLGTNGTVNGKHVRGRSFLVPIAASLTATAEPTADLRAKIVVLGNALLSTTIGPTMGLSVWSRPYAGRTEPTVIAARTGSVWAVTGVSGGSKFPVLTSRRV